MIFTFVNGDGATIPNGGTVSAGNLNYIFIDLVVDGESQSTPITGNITKGGKRIGDFNWEPGVGSIVNWYSGNNRPVYVLDGDVIQANITTTPTSSIAVTVQRIQPNVKLVAGNSDFIKRLEPFTPGSTIPTRIRSTLSKINLDTPVSFSVSNATNVTKIKSYFTNQLPLPDEAALIYATTARTQQILATYTPPTLIDIFNTWDRFSNNNYYPGSGPKPGGDAGAWYWNNPTQSIVQPLNTESVNGFLSNELVDRYDNDVYVRSTDVDDDFNGAVIAFSRVGATNYYLLAAACCDGTNRGANPIASNVFISLNSVTNRITFSNGNRINSGWNGRYKRIRVSRRGDLITVKYGDWSSGVLNPDLTLSVNLNDSPDLAVFKGPKQYGYFSQSQASSTFYNIKYYGGMLRNTIVDAQTNTVYRYNERTSTWGVLTGITAQDVYGSPRILTGESNQRFALKSDGSIQAL